MSQSIPSFSCDSCAKTYAWKPALAARRVKCACGAVISVPANPAPEEDELYDIVPDPVATTAAAVHQKPLQSAPAGAAPAVSYARRETIGESALDRYFPDRVKDLHIPLALIGGGTVIEVLAAMIGGRHGMVFALSFVGAWMIANTILMLITVLIVAKIRSIHFGPLATAVVKLCGISIGPGAIGTLAAAVLFFIPFSGLIGWLVSCVLYFALIGALFDLDESDTWVVVISVFLVKLALLIVLFVYFG